MKKITFMMALLSIIAVQAAYAHPPTDMSLSFDKYTKMLKVNVSHAVSDPRTHYVKEIEVSINGSKVLRHTLTKQDTDAAQYVQYTLPDVESGDIIRVDVRCSSFGKRMKELKIDLED